MRFPLAKTSGSLLVSCLAKVKRSRPGRVLLPTVRWCQAVYGIRSMLTTISRLIAVRGEINDLTIVDRTLQEMVGSAHPTYMLHAVFLFTRNGIRLAENQSATFRLLRFDLPDHGYCLISFGEVWRQLQSNLKRLQRIASVPISEICHSEMVVNRG